MKTIFVMVGFILSYMMISCSDDLDRPIITPNYGTNKGGTKVSISNIMTKGITRVEIGSDCVDLEFLSATELTCITQTHSSGAVDVKIYVDDKLLLNLPLAFTFESPELSLASINPASGATAGGTSVTITGSGLNDAITVEFDGVAGTNLVINSDTELTVDTPAHAAGVVNVKVLNSANEESVLENAFTYLTPPTLTDCTPNTGSASGGVGFVLTGTNFNDATSVTFDGVAATSINVVNSTTITGVTPAHAAGVVDVAVTTPSGTTSLSNEFTYNATAIGQSAHGGIIAGLSGGLNNLIATPNDITGIWGTMGVDVGALDANDGATNTVQIVTNDAAAITSVAHQCNNYSIDSQGNTPCLAGNQCYSDWFLASQAQSSTLYINRVAIGNFVGTFYWYSMQGFTPADNANVHGFHNGSGAAIDKDQILSARCVRHFTP